MITSDTHGYTHVYTHLDSYGYTHLHTGIRAAFGWLSSTADTGSLVLSPVAYLVMAYVVMAYIVMAWETWARWSVSRAFIAATCV